MENRIDLPIPESNPRNIVIFGLIVVFLLFGAIGGWMAYAPLAASSVATGKVITNKSKLNISHLEGGIIDKIYVKDGDVVKKGDPLIKLKDIKIKAQIAQINKQIDGYQSLLKSKKQILANIEKEIKELNRLYKEKLVDKKRLRELKKQKISLLGEMSNTKAEIAKAKEQKIILEDKLKRSIIRAPRDGIVMGIDYHSIDEVIPPGRKLFEIIPLGTKYQMLVNINPTDIDKIKIGQESDLSFPTFDMKELQPFKGKVVYISADSITNNDNKASYYQAKIELTKEGEKELKDNNLTLVVGMPVVAMIKLGDRTVLEYLIKPFVDMFRKSFNEE